MNGKKTFLRPCKSEQFFLLCYALFDWAQHWLELIFLQNFKNHASVAFQLPVLLFERYSAIMTMLSQLVEVLRMFPLSWCSKISRYRGMGQSTINIQYVSLRDKDFFCAGNLMRLFSLKTLVLQFRGIILYYSFCVISFLSCSLFSLSGSPLIQMWILLY